MKPPVMNWGNPWKLTIDTEIPDGVITIEPWGYGIGISVNGKYLCAIDLYHRSKESDPGTDDAHGVAQVVIDPEDGGDSIAFIRRFLDGSTEIFFDDGVFLKRFDHGTAFYGYPAPATETE